MKLMELIITDTVEEKRKAKHGTLEKYQDCTKVRAAKK
jgi:hypothetical protein